MSRPVRVLKFGGSSVGNAQAFRHCADVLRATRASGSAPVGVLSAMFGVTNRLLAAVKASEQGDRAALARIRGGLVDAHVKVARELCPPREAEDVCAAIHANLEERVDAVCRDVLGKGRADAYDTDVVSSTGEAWATRIMSAHMSLLTDAPFVDASSVIMTDGVSGNARPLLEASRACARVVLAPLLARGAVPLVTGFYGAAAVGRRLTTLGRGGSDLSAAVLGHCLDAAEVALYKVEYETRPDGWMERWTPGWVGVVHDADPAATIAALHYDEASELAHFSKKVLHPDTVAPAVERGIPITVRNTLDPEHPGTLISGGGTITRVPLLLYEAKNAPIAGVDWAPLGHIARGEAALVALVGLRVMDVPGLAARVTGALARAGIPAVVPRRVNGSANNFSVIVAEAARHAAVQLLHREFVVKGG